MYWVHEIKNSRSMNCCDLSPFNFVGIKLGITRFSLNSNTYLRTDLLTTTLLNYTIKIKNARNAWYFLKVIKDDLLFNPLILNTFTKKNRMFHYPRETRYKDNENDFRNSKNSMYTYTKYGLLVSHFVIGPKFAPHIIWLRCFYLPC